LDCVSIFATCADDAAEILDVCAGFDAADAWSRPAPRRSAVSGRGGFRFGVLAPGDLDFFGDGAAPRCYAAAVERLQRLGGAAVVVDYAPFREAARLLYEGPWVAERYAVVRE